MLTEEPPMDEMTHRNVRIAVELLLDEPNRTYARELAQSVPALWRLASETADGLLFECPEGPMPLADYQAAWSMLVDIGTHAYDTRGGVTVDGTWRAVPLAMDGQIQPPPEEWLQAHPQPLMGRIKAMLFPRKRG